MQTNPYLSVRAESRAAVSPSYHTWPEPPLYVEENIYRPDHEPLKLQAQAGGQELGRGFRSTSVSSDADGEVEEDDSAMLDRALEFARHHHVPLPLAYTPRLRKPVAIPQVSPKMNSPFARAYSEVLSAYSIRIEEFVQFIDNFNILMTGSPPLAALNTVGQVLGLVPHHWAHVAGGITTVAAGVATFAVIKTRCAKFVKLSNVEFFEPKGPESLGQIDGRHGEYLRRYSARCHGPADENKRAYDDGPVKSTFKSSGGICRPAFARCTATC